MKPTTTVTIDRRAYAGRVLRYTSSPAGAFVLVSNRKRRVIVWRPRMGDIIAKEG